MSRVPHVRAALTSAGFAALAHWTLAAHRPAALLDPTNPLASPLMAQSVAARAVDALTSALPLAQDIATGPWLVLMTSAAVATSWLARLGLPQMLALGFGIGLTFQRTPWSSHGAGRDALVMLGALLVAHAFSVPGTPLTRRAARAVGTVVLVLVAHQPSLAWLLAPLCWALVPLTPRERRWWAGLTVACALAAALVDVVLVRNADVCMAGTGLATWISAAIFPGRVPDATPWVAITRAATALVTNVHLFGLVAAAWAIWLVGDRFREWRRLSLAGTLATLTTVAIGAATTETFVYLALVLWLPWYALAGQLLWRQTDGRWRVPGRVTVFALAVLLPMGRHAIVVPAPIATDVPHVRALAAASIGDAVHVVGDLQHARQARTAGQAVIPVDRLLLEACLARGRQVVASGSALQTLRDAGADVAVLRVAVPLTALLGDVRPDAVVAFGATSAALRWLRPADSNRLRMVGLDADDLQTRRAQALVVSVPAVADPSRTTHAESAATDVATVGGRTLWHQLRVTTSSDGVLVEARSPGPVPLVHGRSAAIAVFDRAEAAVVRGTASAEPGLPIALFSASPSLTWARVVAWPARSADGRPSDAGAGVPLLPGVALVVDDDTHRTVPVTLGDGWHDAEPAGRAFFRWSARADATASFRLEGPSPLTISVDAAPAQTADRPNTLTLLLNGVPIGAAVHGAATIEVPESMTRGGSNTLSFGTDVVIPPGVVLGEPRTLGAVVRHIRVERR